MVAKFHCPRCKKDRFEIKILDNDDEVTCCRNCGWVYFTLESGVAGPWEIMKGDDQKYG